MSAQRRFLVIAHRGASAYAPENTLAAFDRALELGFPHLELDTHLSADGHVVVIHDDTLERTTSGRGRVAEHTLAQLRALDAGAWFGGREFQGQRVPALEEVLGRYRGRAHLHVELKGRQPDLPRAVLALVDAHNARGAVTLTSFHRELVAEARRLAPDVPVGWLVPQLTEEVIEEARALGLAYLCPRAATVAAEQVARAHRRGVLVRPWGVRSPDDVRHAVRAGAVGLTADWPDVAQRIVEEELAAQRGTP